MAILVISARNFASLLREACDPNQLKIKRLIERFTSKKHQGDTLRINMAVEDLGRLNATIWEQDFSKRGLTNEELAAALDKYSQEVVDGEPPYVAYSMSEWKAIIEIATQCDSTINLSEHDMHLVTVQYNLKDMYEAIKPMMLEMIKRGYDVAPKLILPPGVESHV